MGKSKQNDNFDSQGSRGMHRSEDDLGYMDQDLTDDMPMIPTDPIMSGESTNASTATMKARTKTAQEQTSLQKKRGNQPEH